MIQPRIYSANVGPQSLLAAEEQGGVWSGRVGGEGRGGREIRERANIWVRLGVALCARRVYRRVNTAGRCFR